MYGCFIIFGILGAVVLCCCRDTFLNFDIFPFLVCAHSHMYTLHHAYSCTRPHIHTHTHSHTMHTHTGPHPHTSTHPHTISMHVPTLTHVHTLTQCIPIHIPTLTHVAFTGLAFHAQLLDQQFTSPVEQLDIYPLILSCSPLPPPLHLLPSHPHRSTTRSMAVMKKSFIATSPGSPTRSTSMDTMSTQMPSDSLSR